MIREFRLPDPGEGIHEAEILEVYVSAGDTVQEGDIILHIETDKAAIEIPSPFSGVIEEIRVKTGDVVQVGEVLMTFAVEEGKADRPKAKPQSEQQAKEEERKRWQAEREAPVRSATAEGVEDSTRRPVAASPATRQLARELGVDLHQVLGSGPERRVTAEDVRAFAARGKGGKEPTTAVPPLPDFSRWGPIEKIPLRSIRRATAKQMALAWSQIPHVMHQDIADITDLEAFRRRHQETVEKQ